MKHVIIFSLVLVSIEASSAAFRNPVVSAYAGGRGDAALASTNDASALYYNAASLSEVRSTEFSINSTFVDYEVSVSSAGSNFQTDNGLQVIPSMFFATPFKFGTVGVGLYVPNGLSSQYGDDSTFRSIGISGELADVSLAVGYGQRLSEKLSVGATLVYKTSEIDLAQGVGFTDDDLITFKGDAEDIAYTLGVKWDVNEHHSFGAQFLKGGEFNYEGPTTITGLEERDSQLKIDFADLYQVGYSYKPSDFWDIGFDVEKGNWSSVSVLTLENTGLGDLPFVYNYSDGYIFKLGATYKSGSTPWVWSAGYDYNQSVADKAFYAPLLGEADTESLTFGSGYRARSFDIFVNVIITISGTENVVGSVTNPFSGESADGTYKRSIQSVQGGITYRF